MPYAETSNIVLYGKGIFTTAALRDAEPFLWEKHWRRLTSSAGKLGINVSGHREDSVREAVIEQIHRFGIIQGRARISFLDETPGERWPGGGERKVTLSILIGRDYRTKEKPRLTNSAYLINTTSPLAGIKSCNYLEPLMAFEKAKAAGFDEAIRLNERGEVASACMANVFWLKGERLFTPSLRTGCLAGTTREFILENLRCEEVKAGIESLREADDIFLTSAGLGVAQAAEFDGRKLKCSAHPILELLPL